MTPYIVGGLVLGGIYAISALGLTMTYISSRVLNFAHGGIAFLVAMTFYRLYGVWHWPLAAAAFVSIFLVGPAIGLFLWLLLARHLAKSTTVVMLVATVGLFVALTPLTFLIFSDNPIYQRPGLAGFHVGVYHIFGVGLNTDQITVFVGTLVIGLALAAMLRFTTAGLLIRAVVDSPSLSGLAGTDPRVVGAAAWMLGCLLAGLAGVMLTPLVGLDPNAFTLLIVASLAAVVVARLSSLALAFVGALLLGLSQDISVKYLPTNSIWASGFRPSVPFIVMMVFLLAYQGFGSRKAAATSRVAARGGTHSDDVVTGPWVRPIGFAVVIGLIVLVSLLLSNYWVGIIGSGICLSIALLSYSVVTGQAGILSLCQISFAGLGAVFTAQLATNNHVPGFLALLLGALLVVPIALVVALAAVRLGDLYVALATLAFALLVDNLIFPQNRFDQNGSGMLLNRPHLGPIHFDGDKAFLYLALVVFVLLSLLVRNLRRSTTGMTLVAIRSSETGVSTIGLSVVRAKLVAFGVSGFIAAIGGGMISFYGLRARPDSFSTLVGIIWLAVVITLGVRTSVGPLLAGITFTVFPQLISNTFHWPHWALQLPPLLFGLGAIGLAREPRGAVAQMSNDWIRLAQKVKGRLLPPPPGPPPELQEASASPAAVSLK